MECIKGYYSVGRFIISWFLILKSKSCPASYILEFDELIDFQASVFYIAGVVEPLTFPIILKKQVVCFFIKFETQKYFF